MAVFEKCKVQVCPLKGWVLQSIQSLGSLVILYFRRQEEAAQVMCGGTISVVAPDVFRREMEDCRVGNPPMSYAIDVALSLGMEIEELENYWQLICRPADQRNNEELLVISKSIEVQFNENDDEMQKQIDQHLISIEETEGG